MLTFWDIYFKQHIKKKFRTQVIKPNGKNLRQYFITGALLKLQCSGTWLFGLFQKDYPVSSTYRNVFLLLEHECSGGLSKEIIHLPEINSQKIMTRKIHVSMGYIDLTNQKVQK